jgi:hypothetical protein
LWRYIGGAQGRTATRSSGDERPLPVSFGSECRLSGCAPRIAESTRLTQSWIGRPLPP